MMQTMERSFVRRIAVVVLAVIAIAGMLPQASIMLPGAALAMSAEMQSSGHCDGCGEGSMAMMPCPILSCAGNAVAVFVFPARPIVPDETFPARPENVALGRFPSPDLPPPKA